MFLLYSKRKIITDIFHASCSCLIFFLVRARVSPRKMNPKESAAFIASVSKDVKINQDGIKKVAFEVFISVFTYIYHCNCKE